MNINPHRTRLVQSTFLNIVTIFVLCLIEDEVLVHSKFLCTIEQQAQRLSFDTNFSELAPRSYFTSDIATASSITSDVQIANLPEVTFSQKFY